MADKRIRILMVDDHPLVREGMKVLLTKETAFDWVGEASGAHDALPQIQRLQPDVVILDISLPGESGVSLARRIQTTGSRVLVLSMHDEEEFVRLAFQAGALGYLTKSSPSSEIIEAIRAVDRGEKFIGSQLGKALAERTLLEANDSGEITEREREVLSLVAKGLSAKEIATRLEISHRTVESHRNNLMKKLGARNSAELVRIGLDRGLVQN